MTPAHGQVLLDASALIDYPVAAHAETAAVSTITLAELAYGLHTENPLRDAAREQRYHWISNTFEPIPFSTGAARIYGALCAHARAVGRDPKPRPFGLLIAAVAVDLGVPLITRNENDFRDLHRALTVIAVRAQRGPSTQPSTSASRWIDRRRVCRWVSAGVAQRRQSNADRKGRDVCWECDNPQRPFVYTVGLHGKGLPELLITGPPPQTSARLLNSIAHQIVDDGVALHPVSAPRPRHRRRPPRPRAPLPKRFRIARVDSVQDCHLDANTVRCTCRLDPLPENYESRTGQLSGLTLTGTSTSREVYHPADDPGCRTNQRRSGPVTCYFSVTPAPPSPVKPQRPAAATAHPRSASRTHLPLT